MKIKRVYIENYRSIKKLDFCPNNYCVLIGENNAGKTNILKAINLVLGETWPSERSFSEDDFCSQDTTRDIIIRVFFDEVIEEWRNNHKMKIAGFELSCHVYKRKTGAKTAGSLTTDFKCVDEKGKEVSYPPEPLKKGEASKGRWLPLKVSRDLRAKIPFIYVDVLRNYGKQDPSNRWSILRRLLDDVNTSIANDKSKIKIKTSNDDITEMTRKQAFEYKIREAYELLKTTEFTDIETKIKNNALEQIGISAEEGDVSLHFDTYDPINVFKNLQLYVDQMGISISADMVGAGLQSSIVVAIFRTYEEIKKEGAIFAIEEPEVFLHPQKARYFSDVLNSLSQKNQVFTTTHSPVFVHMHNPEEVCLIRRTDVDGTKAIICPKNKIAKDIKEELKIQNYFDTQRNEMFFAKGAILVEGATEKFALPLACERAKISLNRLGISIVECGGKGNLLMFAKVADAFSIPFVVIADDDIKPTNGIESPLKLEKIEAENKNNEMKNQGLKDFVQEDNLFWMIPNIESELGIPESSDNKVRRIVDYFMKRSIEDIPECIIKPIIRIKEIVGLPN